MLTNAGLSANHVADRIGTRDFHKVLCALGGRPVLAAEKGVDNTALVPAETLHSMESGCPETKYCLGAPNTYGSSMMCLEFELKQEEQQIIRFLTRTHTPLYTNPLELMLKSGRVDTYFSDFTIMK